MKMIKNNLKTLVTMVAMATLFAGCAKIDDFGDLNTNPDVAQPLPASYLTSAESSLPGLAASTRSFLYCQYASETQYTEASLYNLPQLESGPLYSGPLQDLESIINSANASTHYKGIAKVIKSYIFLTITDRWGDVPYSEALKGAGNLAPKYDEQMNIFKGIFADLKSAGTDLGTTSAPVAGDIVYGGNTTKWRKLANTIRMIAALRLSKKAPALAQTEFNDAVTNSLGIITTNADNFSIVHPGGPQGSVFQNPWFVTYFTRDDYAISKTMTDCLSGLGDTRGSVFATPGPGFPYGLTRDLAITYTNSIGNGQGRVLATSKRTETSPIVVIGASQSLLAWAEGLERGWATNGNAKNAYEAGVAASFAEWGVALPAAYLTTGTANYISGSGVAAIGQHAAPWDAIPASQNALTPTPIMRIQLQRWLATYPNGNEGWAEWRRTGVPDLKPTRFATNAGGQIPRRYVYGVNEIATNAAQLALAVARLPGGDKQDSRVWWDQ